MPMIDFAYHRNKSKNGGRGLFGRSIGIHEVFMYFSIINPNT